MKQYVDVLLALPLKQLFTYEVGDEWLNSVNIGCRVVVPFGKGNMKTGLILAVHSQSPATYEAKFVNQVLDLQPITQPKQISFWEWIASYYMAPLGLVFQAAMPALFLLESDTVVYLKQEEPIPTHYKDRIIQNLIFCLKENPSIRVKDLAKKMPKTKIWKYLYTLINDGVVEVKEQLSTGYKPKKEKYIKLASSVAFESIPAVLEQLKRAPKQKELLLQYFSLNPDKTFGLPWQKLKEAAQGQSTHLNALVKKDIFTVHEIEVDRVQFKEQQDAFPILTDAQKYALQEIKNNWLTKSVQVLQGVTGSGKTMLYIHLIEELLSQGKQILYLVPEIALTTQLIERLKVYFGTNMSVFHSRYSQEERVEAWKHVLENNSKGQLVLGTRSAILLPFHELGLVIVDESHENAYKQFDPAPRYHARDAAIVLAHLHKANALLGTATPSLETLYNVKENKFGMVTLNKRFAGFKLPNIQLIDLKDKYKKKRMKGHFSDTLLQAIQDTLDENKQVILFQNRRGYAPLMECQTCGHTPQCPSCDVSLTYHEYKNQLCCHYCNYKTPASVHCTSCKSPSMKSVGFGTEQIEKELNELFPTAAVKRMDLETTRGKHNFKKIIQSFENKEIDILIGTQMVTKGLDFKQVSLVGVLQADQLLNFPDFRAHEKSFQLLTQLAGRAGRASSQGLVLIQTFNPYHQILQQVTTYDSATMVKEQMQDRRDFSYPPFTRLIRIVIRHKNEYTLNEAALWLQKHLIAYRFDEVLGPSSPAVSRIKNYYIRHILIKNNRKYATNKVKELIAKGISTFESIPNFRATKITVDVDPL